MTDSQDWVPEGVDITTPDAARVYDYALGGVHNFKADRDFWDHFETNFPGSSLGARANRAFLGRAVRLLAGQGIRQFLDIGSGIPTLGNVHEVAQEASPDARVVYVDINPVAVQQSRSLLDGNPYAVAIHGDLRKPDEILTDPEVTGLLDFGSPVAVLTVAVLHFIPDSDDPAAILRRLAAALVPGSYLVFSHVGPDESPGGREVQERGRKLYERTPTAVVIRSVKELTDLLGDAFELVEPGIVGATDWHPDPDEADDPPQRAILVGIARRR